MKDKRIVITAHGVETTKRLASLHRKINKWRRQSKPEKTMLEWGENALEALLDKKN